MAESKLPDKKVSEYKEAFEIFDKDGDGRITADELRQVVESMGKVCTPEDAKKMISEADKDKNETIEFGEFVTMMEESMSNAGDEMLKAFKFFDKDGDGKITKDELKLAMKELGENMSDAEIDAMIKSADLDDDHQIDFQEFKNMMGKEDEK
ncbi:EF-hand_1 domain-containing protein [Oopsacas minuta]|uniref:EF-hand_1 domain-containing protein n=1 Tax=Oopsacas minuta TaxID=111878 RepID=A0AAV7K650_9METZ|nr:EF-hand_1 domain-containing protein [Oopsacas minuta]